MNIKPIIGCIYLHNRLGLCEVAGFTNGKWNTVVDCLESQKRTNVKGCNLKFFSPGTTGMIIDYIDEGEHTHYSIIKKEKIYDNPIGKTNNQDES